MLLVFLLQYNNIEKWTNKISRRQSLEETAALRLDQEKRQRLVIIGAGLVGLGAAYRLYEEGILRTTTQVVVLERESKTGGHAMSHLDEAGFSWDNSEHDVLSRYEYFTNLLNYAVPEWKNDKRTAYAFMKLSSGNHSFIPYPVQDNVFSFDKEDRERIIKDLEKLTNERQHLARKSSANFDEWLVNNFGSVLSNMFMRKFSRKMWTVDPKQMNTDWTGQSVTMPNLEKINKKRWNVKDFRFLRYNKTGGIRQALSELLPRCWFHYGHHVTGVSIKKKMLNVKIKSDIEQTYSLDYDILITTAPLDVFVNMDQSEAFENQRQLVNELEFSITHIVGFGLKGQPPRTLSDKSWIYFPDSDSPFYRATVLSKYLNHHIPHPESQWSLICECAQPRSYINSMFWTEKNVIEQTIIALIKYGFIVNEQITSKFYYRLDHGYPVPSHSRESILSVIQPWLESNKVFSRGRFGGWRYEVSNQDHLLMQGVEVVDFILKGIPEETYSKPNLVNLMETSQRSFRMPTVSDLVPDYQVILAHYNEDLRWIVGHSDHCHIYHKGKSVIPNFTFRKWEILPNVGRESHTYLHHIITNYNRLPNVTIFLQAGANEHRAHTYLDPLLYYTEAIQNGFSAKKCYRFRNWNRIKYNKQWMSFPNKGPGSPLFRRSNFTLGGFWKDAFGTDHPEEILSCPNGNFAVTRAIIHKRPIEYYKKLITYLDDSSDPEEGHYFERFWRDGVFSMFQKP